MAHGRAINATPAGVEGMARSTGVDVTGTPSEFAEAILTYLSRPADAQHAGAAAAEPLETLRLQVRVPCLRP